MEYVLTNLEKVIREKVYGLDNWLIPDFIKAIREFPRTKNLSLEDKGQFEVELIYYHVFLRNEKASIIESIHREVNSADSKEKISIFIENTYASLKAIHSELYHSLTEVIDESNDPEAYIHDSDTQHGKILRLIISTIEELQQFLEKHFPLYLLNIQQPSNSIQLKNELEYIDGLLGNKLLDEIHAEYRYGKTALSKNVPDELRDQFISGELRNKYSKKLEQEPLRIMTALKQAIVSVPEETKKSYLQSHYEFVITSMAIHKPPDENDPSFKSDGDKVFDDFLAIGRMIYDCLEELQNHLENNFWMYLNEVNMGDTQSTAQEKIKTSLSVAQLGFLFSKFLEKKVMLFNSKTAATNFAADHFSSERKESISKKQARKKLYSLTEKELRELSDLLHGLYNDVYLLIPKDKREVR